MVQLLIISSLLLWGGLLFNLLITLAVVRKLNSASLVGGSHVDGPKLGGLALGTKAPDFAAQTIEGKSITLASYSGQKIALFFISPFCKPCKDKYPVLNALKTKASQFGVKFVLVSIMGSVDEIKAMINEHKLDMTILIAPNETNPFFGDYKSTGTPSYCLIDENGIVMSTGYPGSEMPAWNNLVGLWESAPAGDGLLSFAKG
jgi:peroxiredoxin